MEKEHRENRKKKITKISVLGAGVLCGALAYQSIAAAGLLPPQFNSSVQTAGDYETLLETDQAEEISTENSVSSDLKFANLIEVESMDKADFSELSALQDELASDSLQVMNTPQFDESVIAMAIEKQNSETGFSESGIKAGSNSSVMHEKKVENYIEVELDDHTEYHGEYQKKLIHGQGEMIFPNKDKYKGTFHKVIRKGNGKYTWKNNDVYEGEWDHDKMHGEGKYTFSNGNSYKGTFKDNKFVSGKAYYKRNNNYTVRYENGKATRMTSTFKNGMRIETDLDNGKVTGQAKITWPTGAKYEGYIENGQRTGEGELVYSNGARYVGTFVKDRLEGDCTYYYSNDQGSLSGNFKNGKPDGQLTYTNAAGESFITDWSNGKCVKVYE